MCRKGRLSDAAVVFRRLVDGGSDEPLHLSYCGLLTATVRGDRTDGIDLCERALRFGAYEPEVVVNLARLYETMGARTKAVKLLRRGLREKPAHPGMVALIDRLAPRCRPPLSVLDRDNPLNKQLAIALAKLSGRYKSGSDESTRRRGEGLTVAAAHVSRAT